VEEIPIHLICESDYTTIPRFRYVFSVVPELLRIKSLEKSGAYDAMVPPRAAPGRPAVGPPEEMG
jgi:hypothetical protein